MSRQTNQEMEPLPSVETKQSQALEPPTETTPVKPIATLRQHPQTSNVKPKEQMKEPPPAVPRAASRGDQVASTPAQAQSNVHVPEAVPTHRGVFFTDEEEKLLAIPEDDTEDDDADAKQKQEHKNARLESLRRKSLLNFSRQDAAMRPKWRIDQDAADGVVSPFAQEPMTQTQIFRAAAFAIVAVVSIQKLSFQRKRGLRDEEVQVMRNMIRVYLEATRTWMAKEVRLPILSVLQDPSMRFQASSTDRGAKKKLGILWTRKTTTAPEGIIQLKVRLKGIVDAIAKTTQRAQDTPDAIVKFLAKFTSDGAYIPPDYLDPDESKALEFNALGATRNMSEPYDPSAPPHRSSRFNVVVVNFVIVRVVIPHLVLRPWEAGFVGSHAKPIAQVQSNLRVLATALYVVCQRLVPFLKDPGAVVAEQTPPSDATFPSLAQTSSLLYPKDVLPLDDASFLAFLSDQETKLSEWLVELSNLVASAALSK
ncbi:unnamed protein product [Aphanomyces euteiches]